MAESGRRLDAAALLDWAHTSVGDLIAHTDEINRLNVFPVADADTGTNMLFTMRAAWAQADASAGGGGREEHMGGGGREEHKGGGGRECQGGRGGESRG